MPIIRDCWFRERMGSEGIKPIWKSRGGILHHILALGASFRLPWLCVFVISQCWIGLFLLFCISVEICEKLCCALVFGSLVGVQWGPMLTKAVE